MPVGGETVNKVSQRNHPGPTAASAHFDFEDFSVRLIVSNPQR